jgi:hypothetical protein
MFFSFSSEIVIVTYGDLTERRDLVLRQKRAEGAARLGSAPLSFGCGLRFQNDVVALGPGNVVQHLIGGVLYARARLVKLAGRLGGELAKGVTVTQCVNGFKNEFRPHENLLLCYE